MDTCEEAVGTKTPRLSPGALLTGWGEGKEAAWLELDEQGCQREESSTQAGGLGVLLWVDPSTRLWHNFPLSKIFIFPSQKTPKMFTPVPAHRVQLLYCPQVQAALCPQPPFTLTWMPAASFLVPALHIFVVSVSCSDAGPTHLHLETPKARQTLPATPLPPTPRRQIQTALLFLCQDLLLLLCSPPGHHGWMALYPPTPPCQKSTKCVHTFLFCTRTSN